MALLLVLLLLVPSLVFVARAVGQTETTAVFQISSKADDVVEAGDTALSLYDGAVSVGRGNGSATTDVGLRWTNVSLPKGAIVREAHVAFTSYTYGLEPNVRTVLKGAEEPSPGPFSSSHRPSALPKTSAAVAWDLPAWKASTVYDSPDLKDVIQEIVDQPGWQPGNALGLVWEDNGTEAWCERRVHAYDFWMGSQNAAKLYVTYLTENDRTPPGPVSDLTATPGDAQVTLSWTNPADADFAAVKVLRSGSEHAGGATPSAGQVEVYEGSASTCGDPGLTNDATYYYTAFARDSGGNWSSAATVSATPQGRPPDTTPPVISNVASANSAPGAATITWDTDEPATSQIEHGVTTGYGSLTNLDSDLLVDHTQALTGLVPSTTYHYRVRSSDEAGNGSVSSDFTLVMGGGLPVQSGAVVSFSFDDTCRNQYTNAFPILRGRGFPGTVYVVTASVGKNSLVLSAADLADMQNSGWEISSHSKDHLIGANSPPDAYESSVRQAKEWLDGHGFPDSGFASPGGGWSHDVVSTVRKYHPYLRTANGLSNSAPYDAYMLSARSLNAYTTLDSVKTWLDEAQQKKQWIVLLVHGVSDDGFDTRPALLRSICDEIARRAIPVHTVRDVIRSTYPPSTSIDVWADSHQAPALATFSDYEQISSATWNEYWEDYRGYPVVMGHSGNKGLPVMRFWGSVPNGTYQVMANLKRSGSTVCRYYYSFDQGNPTERSVDVDDGIGYGEQYLGSVVVTNGAFEMYVQRADAFSGPNSYFGWAWVKLMR